MHIAEASANDALRNGRYIQRSIFASIQKSKSACRLRPKYSKVCVCVCMYGCVWCACMYARVHADSDPNIQRCVCVCEHVCVWLVLCIYGCMRAGMYVLGVCMVCMVCMYVCIYVCMYVCMHACNKRKRGHSA